MYACLCRGIAACVCVCVSLYVCVCIHVYTSKFKRTSLIWPHNAFFQYCPILCISLPVSELARAVATRAQSWNRLQRMKLLLLVAKKSRYV